MVKKTIIGYTRKILSQNVFLPVRKNNRLVFAYHHIATPADDYFEGSTTMFDTFKQQVEMLAKNFTLLSLDEITPDKMLPGGKNYAALTFDDGFDSVRTLAMPYLVSKGIPFAVFVNRQALTQNQLWVTNLQLNRNNNEYLQQVWQHFMADKVSFEQFRQAPVTSMMAEGNFDAPLTMLYTGINPARKLYMNEADLKALHQKGVLVGNHTADHCTMANCSKEVKNQQITDNQNHIEKTIASEAGHFAIPFGKKNHFDQLTVDACIQNGLKYIYTTNPACFKPAKIDQPFFLIPRIGVTEESPQEMMFSINRTFIRKYDL